MKLYLIRHGVAEERGEAWADDAKRPLTQDGMSKLRKAARALRNLGVVLDVIVTSPLVRTRQTAEALAASFREPPPIVNSQALTPTGTLNAVIEELAKQSHRRKKIAVVGHEPGIGELAGRLLGLRKALEFRKGAIARIDVAALPLAGPGQLRWFLTRARPLHDAGGHIVRWFGSSTNIDERRRNDDFREMFLGILGHDLRNPLSTILMTSRLLAVLPDTPDAITRKLARVTSSGVRMQRMIEQLLDLTRARLTDGIPVQIPPEALDLSPIVARIVDEIRAANPARAIEMSVDGACMLPVDADRGGVGAQAKRAAIRIAMQGRGSLAQRGERLRGGV